MERSSRADPVWMDLFDALFQTSIRDVKFSVFEAVRGSPYCLAYGFFSGRNPSRTCSQMRATSLSTTSVEATQKSLQTLCVSGSGQDPRIFTTAPSSEPHGCHVSFAPLDLV